MTPRSVFFDYINPFVPWLIIAAFVVFVNQRTEALFDDAGSIEDYDEADYTLVNDYERFCANPAGEDVLFQIASLLDERRAPYLRFDQFVSERTIVMATSYNSMAVSTGAMKNLAPDQLAALMAHEIGHMRNGNFDNRPTSDMMIDAMFDNDQQFTDEQEELADQTAMDLMIDAGIPTDGATALFDLNAVSQQASYDFQHRVHPGIPARSNSWSAARTRASVGWEEIDPVGLTADCLEREPTSE